MRRDPLGQSGAYPWLHYDVPQDLAFLLYLYECFHLMTLNIYKDMLDKMDLTQAALEFVRGNEHRQKGFGNF